MTFYWLDWENGDDAADGLTPETAFLTERRLHAATKSGPPVDVTITMGESRTASRAAHRCGGGDGMTNETR